MFPVPIRKETRECVHLHGHNCEACHYNDFWPRGLNAFGSDLEQVDLQLPQTLCGGPPGRAAPLRWILTISCHFAFNYTG